MSGVFGQRFLVIYSGVLTAVFAATVLVGFTRSQGTMHLDQLDVHRINVTEPDGTLRMVISDRARFPGVIVKGHDHPFKRPYGGMLFYNDEGTENGGLVFGGSRRKDGTESSWGHLSFDRYEQDQTLVLEAGQDKTGRTDQLAFVDRPDVPITGLLRVLGEKSSAQRTAEIRAFVKAHPSHRRLVLARLPDKSVQIGLTDPQGRPRIVMKVAADGTPSIRLLDAHGKVVGQLVPRSAR